MRSPGLGRKVSVITTELQFIILDSTRDVVAGSPEQKCGLKYVIFTQAKDESNEVASRLRASRPSSSSWRLDIELFLLI